MLGLMNIANIAGALMGLVGSKIKSKPLTILGVCTVIGSMAYTVYDIWSFYHDEEET